MADLDAAYWTGRYRNQETAWDIGSPSAPIKAYIDQLGNRQLRILIPGAGNAYEAEYLLHAGFTNVTVCDLSALPLQNLAERTGSPAALTLIEKDFFDLTGQYDLVLEQTFFCAIDPSLRRAYFTRMLELLSPGGKLAGVLFDDKLNDDRPPFGGSREEYLQYLPETFERVVFEACYNSIAPRAGREIFMLLRKKP